VHPALRAGGGVQRDDRSASPGGRVQHAVDHERRRLELELGRWAEVLGLEPPGNFEIVEVGRADLIERRDSAAFERLLLFDLPGRDREKVSLLSGQAIVRLTALNQRMTPTVGGEVIYLSADALSQQTTAGTAVSNKPNMRQDYYVVRIRLDEAELRERLPGFHQTPGMPADVFIKTGERTFFDYIMRPVLDSLSKAFREH
jgi:hypothetical protein